MIAIVNTGANPFPDGCHEYEVRINRKVICKFTHQREQPLSVCLTRALKAVKQYEREVK